MIAPGLWQTANERGAQLCSSKGNTADNMLVLHG